MERSVETLINAKMHLHSDKFRCASAFVSLYLWHISSLYKPQYPFVGQEPFLMKRFLIMPMS